MLRARHNVISFRVTRAWNVEKRGRLKRNCVRAAAALKSRNFCYLQLLAGTLARKAKCLVNATSMSIHYLLYYAYEVYDRSYVDVMLVAA